MGDKNFFEDNTFTMDAIELNASDEDIFNDVDVIEDTNKEKNIHDLF